MLTLVPTALHDRGFSLDSVGLRGTLECLALMHRPTQSVDTCISRHYTLNP